MRIIYQHIHMTIPVPTLTFGTIRRLSLLNIFAFAKID